MDDTSPVEQYDADGAVCLRQVFAPYWIDLLRRGVERNLAAPGRYGHRYTGENEPGLFFGDYCNWARIPEYREFLFESPAASIAGRFMRSCKVNLFHEHVLVKEPGTSNRTPWHHDMPYWTLAGDQVCSLWIPLDPVARETAVEYVLGSHRWNHWYRPRRFVDGGEQEAGQRDGFLPVPDIDGDRAQYPIAGWEMQPGDCILFHGLTLHGAPGNCSTDRRRAVATRWTGDDVRYSLRPGVMSPPPAAFEDAPTDGAPMDSGAFPVVWSAH
jgi:ectoine hydroxylase-related dioxygenase (phytanoyl-CoA dioxygenase family)